MYVSRLYPDFEEWCNERDFFGERLSIIIDRLLEYYLGVSSIGEHQYIDPLLVNADLAAAVVERLPETNHCKDVEDFNCIATVAAYGIWHFLDRYTRFQILYMVLLELGVLPVRYAKINALDVATGPAASMYALSDIYAALRQYGSENAVLELAQVQYRPDYVENSSGFRQWVHHYTELLDLRYHKGLLESSEEYLHHWEVPYHHGNFHDVFNTNFKSTAWWKRRNRGFHIVTVGNFIVEEEHLEPLKDFLTSVVYGSRNGALLVFIGNGDRHRRNMARIEEHMNNLKMTEIKATNGKPMKFDRSSATADKICSFYQQICDRLQSYDLLETFDERTAGDLKNRTQNRKLRGKWIVHVYRKGRLPAAFR